jgi:hypothetical protein
VAAVAAAPVTTAPAPMAAATPAPMAAAPAPVAATPTPTTSAPPAPMSSTPSPSYFFGLQMLHLVPVSDGGTGILVRRRQRSVLCERMRHQRCCPCTRGECGGARGKSKGQFQKVAAFHDIFLSVRASDAERVSPRRDERSVNPESQLQRAINSGGSASRSDKLPHPAPSSSASTKISRVRLISGQQRSNSATSGFSASPLVARSSAALSGNSYVA